MKKLAVKLTAIGALFLGAYSANSIDKTRFDGGPIPICTPTTCLPPSQLPPPTGSGGGVQ